MKTKSLSRVGRCLAVFALLWGAACSVAAADPLIRTFLRPDTGITDTQVLQFTIQVENAREEVRTDRLPDLRNLGVLSGPSVGRSTQMQMGPSGTVSSTTHTFTWSLRALGPGEAAIPPVTVRIGDKSYSTREVRFQVAAGSADAPTRASGADPSSQVYLQAELSEHEVYVGEPVLLTVTLLARPELGDLQWVDRPGFNRFWVEQVPTDPDRERYVTTVAGQEYMAYPLERRMLVPTGHGTVILDPYSLQVRLLGRRRGLFGRDQGPSLIRKSKPLELVVKALPLDGRPDSFSGAVGQFLMSAELDRSEAQVDDAVAFRVTVEGEGFLKPVQPPVLDPPPGLRLQEPNSEESNTIRSGRMISHKTWEWLVLPSTPGKIRLPEVRFSWFDPEAGAYREQQDSDLVLQVVKGDGEGAGSLPGGRLALQGADIQYIKLARDDLELGSSRVHQRAWFQWIALLPWVLLPATILVGRVYARRTGDLKRVRSRKARSRARKRLAAAAGLMETGQGAEFHEGVARALVEYVADRFDRSSSGLTYDDVERLLVSRSVPGDLVRRFRDCLEACDFARYVPATGRSERREEMIGEARAVLNLLEGRL